MELNPVFARRLYLALLVHNIERPNVPKLVELTGWPRRTIQDVLKALPGIGIELMFIQDGRLSSFDGVLGDGDSVFITYDSTSDQGVLSLITASESVVRFDVRPKPKINLVHNQILLSEVEGGTLVNWIIGGDLSAGLLSPYLALFANDIAGNNFERSLNQLKMLIERQNQ